VANIFEAKEGDYQKATQRIYRSKEYPSRVEISVVPEGQGRRARDEIKFVGVFAIVKAAALRS